jgi:hypothetical protein
MDFRRSAGHLGDRAIEKPTRQTKTERIAVKRHGLFQVIYVDIDQRLHSRSSMLEWYRELLPSPLRRSRRGSGYDDESFC